MTVYAVIVGCSFEIYIKDHEPSQPAVLHTEKSTGPTSSHSASVAIPSTNVSALTQSDPKEAINDNQDLPSASTFINMDSVSKWSYMWYYIFTY